LKEKMMSALRGLVVCAVVAAAGCSGAPEQEAKQAMFEEDVIQTSAGDLKITFVGHGTLMFTAGDRVIHVDPVSREADYTKMPKADLIVITHEHRDHLDPDAIAAIRHEGTPIVVPPRCADAAGAFKPKILYPYHTGDTDVSKLVELVKDVEGVEVRVRSME
jgi:hypothetical protein